jgi:hypothetical protein
VSLVIGCSTADLAPRARGPVNVGCALVARRLAPGFRIGASFSARFDDDATRLVTLGKRITLWDVASRARVATGPPLAHASSIAFAPDGRLLAAKNTVGDVLVLDVPELGERARFSGAGFGEGNGIHVAPDGRHVIDGSWSGLLSVRDVATGAVVWQEAGDSIFGLTATRDRCTWVYDRSGAEGEVLVRAWPFDENPPVAVAGLRGATALAITDDGLRLAVAGDGLAVLQRASSAEPWQMTARIDDPPRGGTGEALSWDASGELLAYAARGATIFDANLHIRHREERPYASDAHFAATGSLVAFGDWSAGLVLPWPLPDVGQSSRLD